MAFPKSQRKGDCISDVIRLDVWVRLIHNLRKNRWGWRRDQFRPDKALYATQDEAVEAAAEFMKKALQCDTVVVDVSKIGIDEEGLPRAESIPERGEKRRRAGGHGYAGGDGFVRLP